MDQDFHNYEYQDLTQYSQVERPDRESTESIILHRIFPYGRTDPHHVAEFFLTDPWGIAPILFPSKKVGFYVKQWRSMGRVPQEFKDRAFCPYHFLVSQEGEVCQTLPLVAKGAHAGKENNHSIGIGFIGDFRKEPPTDEQIKAGLLLVRDLLAKYGAIDIFGHDEVRKTPKGCPGHLFPSKAFQRAGFCSIDN